MTIDKAIKRYSINAEYERTHGNLQGCLEFRQLADWLKELKQLREQTRWIPVSEKVPEEFADVLCCTDSNEIFIAKYLGKMNDGTDCFDDDDGMMQEGDLIAWMPLPEPYKAESEELKPKRRMYKGCENCKNYQNRICIMTGDELAMVCEEWEAKDEQG